VLARSMKYMNMEFCANQAIVNKSYKVVAVFLMEAALFVQCPLRCIGSVISNLCSLHDV